jgi:peroxiredoxin
MAASKQPLAHTRPRSRRARVPIVAPLRASALVLALCVVGLPVTAASASPSANPSGTRNAAPPETPRLPSVEGRTIDGKYLATSSFAGKRLLLFCFNPSIEQATVYAQAMANVASERTRHNFAIAGVALGLDPANARSFAVKLGLDFPIFDDSSADIGTRLGLQAPLVLLGADAAGRVGLAMFGLEDGVEVRTDAVEARIREYLRIPKADAVPTGALDQRPAAPRFEAERLDRGTPFRLADLAGKPVVLTFFLPSCPHCQSALRFLKEEFARTPEKSRPVLVGVSIDGRSYAVETTLASEKLDFFPVLLDPDRAIATAYGAFAGVPDIVLIDASGRIAYRSVGWVDERDPALMRMRLASLIGAQVPMLLDAGGFSGNDKCAVCHPMETATWRYTDHAVAFDTLVARGADHDPECVGCHVVGFGAPGGYSEAKREPHLENVGCEVCHGPGGGHLASKSKTLGVARTEDYLAVCQRCHDPEHSLGFEYTSFLPKISHAAVAALDDTQRARLVTGRGQPRDLLPANAAFVGSDACRSCHQHEYAVWSGSAHARSIDSLRKDRKDDEAGCLRCHVTGYARPGGFPDGGRTRANEDLARVGCESCHGPGGEHIRNDGKRPGGIVRLADKCDSCVILQICGACHDDANDPDFRFKVADKIDAQRHGSPREAKAAKAPQGS